MSKDDRKHRSHLPMPNTERVGLITYDAKNPDTKFPTDRDATAAERRSECSPDFDR